MKERVFVPVDCPCCHRRSIQALAMIEVDAALEADAPIMLQCAFDDSRWAATPTERGRIARLDAEHHLMAGNTWLQLRSDFSDRRAW